MKIMLEWLRLFLLLLGFTLTRLGVVVLLVVLLFECVFNASFCYAVLN